MAPRLLLAAALAAATVASAAAWGALPPKLEDGFYQGKRVHERERGVERGKEREGARWQGGLATPNPNHI